jgi:hypothetical protein
VQALLIELGVEDGQRGGDGFNVYAGVDAKGRPGAIDFAAPLNGTPVALMPGVGRSPGHLGGAYLAGRGTDAVFAGGARRLGLNAGRPVVRYRSDERFYFGAFAVTARPVSAGGDDHAAGNVTATVVVNSAPRSPTDVKLTGHDPVNDQVVIGLTPSVQFG